MTRMVKVWRPSERMVEELRRRKLAELSLPKQPQTPAMAGTRVAIKVTEGGIQLAPFNPTPWPTCNFIVSNDGDAGERCCQDARSRRDAYCETHAKLCYQTKRPPPRKRPSDRAHEMPPMNPGAFSRWA